ncbi:cationic amino acid transporter 2, partial [Frankliniella occidentalis]|uniref:Cationic amino acid transporter 2 n=1 Tax=Frankliniella occidentalis TaxID=133901 RepID=A0A9C6XVA9_FRAOC
VYYGNTLHPDQLKASGGVHGGSASTTLGSAPPSSHIPGSAPGPPGANQRVMVRRVTRRYSSPDSDDTLPGEDQEEDFSGRDDQFLVSDRSENKFYGSVHGASSHSGTGPMAGVQAAVGPSLGYLSRRLQTFTYLCPAIFPWVDNGPATEESGMFVMKMVGVLYVLILIFDLIVVCATNSASGATTFFLVVFFLAIMVVLLIISRKPQNRKTLLFMTPGLPFVPAIAVTVNVYLIFKLSILTLVRFCVWMTLGFAMYFMYGIKNSSLEEAAQDGDEPSIELSVTNDIRAAASSSTSPAPAAAPPSKRPAPSGAPASAPAASSSSASRPPPPSRAPTRPPAPLTTQQSQSGPLFMPSTAFPTWDD